MSISDMTLEVNEQGRHSQKVVSVTVETNGQTGTFQVAESVCKQSTSQLPRVGYPSQRISSFTEDNRQECIVSID